MARATKAVKASSKATTVRSDSKTPPSKIPRGRRKSSTTFPTKVTSTERSNPKTQRSARGTVRCDQEDLSHAASPLTAIFAGDRRFSNLYGHGHLLEDPTHLVCSRLVSPRKRKPSGNSEELPPKRVRFARPEDDETCALHDGDPNMTTDPTQLQSVRSEDFSIAQRALRLNADFIFQPDVHLLAAIADATEPLSVSEISSLLRILQKFTGDFAARFFGPAIDDDAETVDVDMQTFPLEDLEMKHYSLYMTTLYVLDASTTDVSKNPPSVKNTGWLKFFAHPNYRPYLVSAILGEWFCQRIFKDTAFGLSEDGRKEMHESVDTRYLYFDSFTRAKKRSNIVARYRQRPDANFWLQRASCELADELMIVLAPLLPFFKPSDPYNEDLSLEDGDHKNEIRSALIELIQHCAATNLSIVRSGENGTVVRSANRLENGKQFFHTAPMECVNPELSELGRDNTELGKDERLVVKLTCWPRMEAWVPHGLDMEEMGRLEQVAKLQRLPRSVRAKVLAGEELSKQEIKQVPKEFCWDCELSKTAWDELPPELWQADRQRRQRQEAMIKSYDLRSRREKMERVKQRGGVHGVNGDDSGSSDSSNPSDFNEDYVSNDSEKTGTETDEDDPPHGPWITEFTCLAPHMVYCEWVKPEDYYATLLGRGDELNTGERIREVNSLRNAITEARQGVAFPFSAALKKDDLLLKLWNFYASHNVAIEWGVFSVAFVVWLSRIGFFDLVGRTISLPFTAAWQLVVKVCEVTGVEMPSITFRNLARRAEQTGMHRGTVRLLTPERILTEAKGYVDSNYPIFKTALLNIWGPSKDAYITSDVGGSLTFTQDIASMKHFTGHQPPFTSNPINQIGSLGTSAIATLGPAVTAYHVSHVVVPQSGRWWKFGWPSGDTAPVAQVTQYQVPDAQGGATILPVTTPTGAVWATATPTDEVESANDETERRSAPRWSWMSPFRISRSKCDTDATGQGSKVLEQNDVEVEIEQTPTTKATSHAKKTITLKAGDRLSTTIARGRVRRRQRR